MTGKSLKGRGHVKRPLPSAEYLRERLRYDAETGKLYWRRHPSMPTHWNTRYAGKEAMTLTNRDGYRCGSIDNYRLFAHRVIWVMVHGEEPKKPNDIIDHIDHDSGNNRIENLRAVSHQENCRNSRPFSHNTTGVTGVHWHKPTNKWCAVIQVDGRGRHIGSFTEFADAVAARKEAERSFGFHPNHGRDLTKELSRG